MKLFVALGAIATFQLCFLRASALEEQDVVNQDMDMELAPELEEYDGDDQDVGFEEDYNDSDSRDLRARPPKHPFCIRTKLSGWGGQCRTPEQLLDVSCDFIWPNQFPPNHIGPIESLCRDNGTRCCVDCSAPKQLENCGALDHLSSPTRRECCSGDLVLRHMESGCKCCGKCKPSRRYCTKRGGFCVTRDDPVYSFDYCTIELGWTLYAKRCEGRHCKCCIPPFTK